MRYSRQESSRKNSRNFNTRISRAYEMPSFNLANSLPGKGICFGLTWSLETREKIIFDFKFYRNENYRIIAIKTLNELSCLNFSRLSTITKTSYCTYFWILRDLITWSPWFWWIWRSTWFYVYAFCGNNKKKNCRNQLFKFMWFKIIFFVFNIEQFITLYFPITNSNNVEIRLMSIYHSQFSLKPWGINGSLLIILTLYALNSVFLRFSRYNQIKITYNRLPTHRCCVHRKKFRDPFLFWNQNFEMHEQYEALWGKELIKHFFLLYDPTDLQTV